MKLTVRGQGPITLTESDFVAEGGEGKVYARGDRIFKVHHAHTIPEGKIAELQHLTRPNILTPQEVLLDGQQRPVGFTMRRIRDAIPLAQLFASSFWQRHGLTPVQILELVRDMAATIRHIHRGHCLMVDGNELNYLTDPSFATPYFIDTDSYQTPSFPATAQMPTIRDYHAQGFTEATDWFAFAIVACQLLLGIHPYKGRHPAFPPGSLEARMRANLSIFNPDTHLPPSVRPTSLLPPGLKAWMVRLFEQGDRLPPPDPLSAPLSPMQKSAKVAPVHLLIALFRDYPDPPHAFSWVQGKALAATATGLFVEGHAFAAPAADAQLLLTPTLSQPVAAHVEDGRLVLTDLIRNRAIPHTWSAERILVAANTLYLWQSGQFTELLLHETRTGITPVVRATRYLLPHATRFFDGFLLTDALGLPTVTLPFSPGRTVTTPLPELKGYEPLAGRFSSGVLLVAAMEKKAGRIDHLLFRFRQESGEHDCTREEGADQPLVNFAVLEHGVVARIVEEGVAALFSREPDRPEKRLVRDPALRADHPLYAMGGALLWRDGKEMMKVTMRP